VRTLNVRIGYAASVFCAGCVLAAAVGLGDSTPFALADPDPEPTVPVINCDAAGYQRVAAGVALATADYMDAHPDVRDAYTQMKSDNVKPNEEVALYLGSRPEVAAAMTQLRQPLKDLMVRCGWGVPSV